VTRVVADSRVNPLPVEFAGIAPVTAQTLSYCTGACGSCGGSCVGSVGVMAFLAILAKYKHQSYKEDSI
jgi:hypothetical protein